MCFVNSVRIPTVYCILLAVLLLPYADGDLIFTQEPGAKLYLQEGSNANLTWDYKVDNRTVELKYITWSVLNKTQTKYVPMIAEYKNFDVQYSPEALSAYGTERLKKEGKATLVIKDITFEDSTDYKCILGGETGINLESVVELVVTVPASVEQAENEIVKEGDNVEVYCNVTGIPDPTVTWTNVKSGNLTVKGNWLNITNITRAQAGEYRCTANNTCGEASTVVDIDVQYKPEDVRLTTNTTVKVCAGMIMNFTCTAEANPEADTYLLYENDVMIMNMGKLGTQIKTMKTDGGFVFRCEANNSVQGTGRSSDTNLTVDVATSIELEEKTIVKEGDDVEVYCNASGIPGPTVTWTNATSGDLIEGNPLNITDITRAQAGKYRCTANNTCGNESTVVEIDVQYPPSITSDGRTITVTEGSGASIPCPVDGNPQPNITWHEENSSAEEIEKSTLEFPKANLSDRGSYICSAKNYLGTVRVTIRLIVEIPPTTTTSSTPTTEVAGSPEVHATATIDVNCDKRSEVERRFPSMACKLNKDKGCVSAEATDSRCGSVIIDFVMNFNQSVDGNKVLDVLKDAAEQNKFGDYKVDPNSIKQISPSSTDAPSTQVHLWIIVICAVAGVVIICAIIAIVAWCVHKKRKCRKDPPVHVEEQPLSRQHGTRADVNPYAHDNNGYAVAGLTEGQYAVEDKSTKKKKEELDATDAQDDMSKSKKSKKSMLTSPSL